MFTNEEIIFITECIISENAQHDFEPRETKLMNNVLNKLVNKPVETDLKKSAEKEFRQKKYDLYRSTSESGENSVTNEAPKLKVERLIEFVKELGFKIQQDKDNDRFIITGV